MIKDDWKNKRYSFFSNVDCEFFPCHDNAGGDDFNCLFCYCPLYRLDCGGDFHITENGVKDCGDCLFPHMRDNYGEIINILGAGKK